jgi:cytidine deaminase
MVDMYQPSRDEREKAAEIQAIVADKPITPCGMCRRALPEFNS